MNLENIASLSSILFKAGFENLSYRLLQHICCRPSRFALAETVQRPSSRITCILYFERKATDYVFTHYDASLIREQIMPAITINQVKLDELHTRMEEIDWTLAAPKTVFRLNDASTWEREQRIEEVMNDMARLTASEEGRAYGNILKVRFWSGKIMEDMVGGLAAIRSRMEVTQRFYQVDGECITIEEAIRFLQNRWMDKRIQAERKQVPEEGSSADGGGKSGKLLKKRRVAKQGRPVK